ncbi:hypothetical protein Bca4012_059064 [Brassica carinata]
MEFRAVSRMNIHGKYPVEAAVCVDSTGFLLAGKGKLYRYELHSIVFINDLLLLTHSMIPHSMHLHYLLFSESASINR